MHDVAEPTDEALAIQAARGDAQAFDDLFHRNHARIFGLCFRFLGSHHDAEDVVQEVFIKVARALPQFQGRSSVRTWLYRIACRTASDWVRSRRRRGCSVEFDEASLDNQESRTEGSNSERSAKLLAALQRLSADQRQAILLVYSEDLSHHEAAKALGCAETTVSWRVFVAKRRLKKLLTDASLEKDLP